jgi:hypothetical protein
MVKTNQLIILENSKKSKAFLLFLPTNPRLSPPLFKKLDNSPRRCYDGDKNILREGFYAAVYYVPGPGYDQLTMHYF